MSATFGRLQAALASATNEVTIAAANLNFDFTLVKYEAPKEFQLLGELLPATKKMEAETGSAHVTARRLGAMFDGVCSPSPNLIKAYGTRVSEITSKSQVSQLNGSKGSMFSDYMGVDGTSIWAAATSSKAALHVHLLACLLARIWTDTEAVSIWVELVKMRREEIANRFQSGEQVHFSLATAAAQSDIPRNQLADWDASVRAWLRTADEVKGVELAAVQDLLRGKQIKVSKDVDTYSSVIEVWRSVIDVMEKLLAGIPQAVADGSIILAITSWHLYPNLAIFGKQNFEVNMDDRLVPTGGIVSLGMTPSGNPNDSGVFWSLNLAHLRHYGKPVRKEGRMQEDSTRITSQDFLYGGWGSISTTWKLHPRQTRAAFDVFQELHYRLNSKEELKAFSWLTTLNDMASMYKQSAGSRYESTERMIQFGRKRPIFSQATSDTIEENDLKFTTAQDRLFGLLDLDRLLKYVVGSRDRVKFMRYLMLKMANTGVDWNDYICWARLPSLFTDKPNSWSDGEGVDGLLATVIPPSGNLTLFDEMGTGEVDGETERAAKRQKRRIAQKHHSFLSHKSLLFLKAFSVDVTEVTEPGDILQGLDPAKVQRDGSCLFVDSGAAAPIEFSFFCGNKDFCVVFRRSSKPRPVLPPTLIVEDVLWCFRNVEIDWGNLFKDIDSLENSSVQFFRAISAIHITYKPLPDARLSIRCFQKPIMKSRWYVDWEYGRRRGHPMELAHALAIVAYCDSGTCDLDPVVLENVVAISSGDSIYVTRKLLCDPSEMPRPYELSRLLGNVGKPGTVLLNPPAVPMIRELDLGRVMALAGYEPKFDGKKVDAFSKTSLHLSFTEYYVPVYDRETTFGEDTQVSIIESVISVRDGGDWVADIDILGSLRNDRLLRLDDSLICTHNREAVPQSPLQSVEDWEVILDRPLEDFVVRAHGNWAARLAITTILLQNMSQEINSQVTICPPGTCWFCAIEARGHGIQSHALIY